MTMLLNELAHLVSAIGHCDDEWRVKHTARLNALVREYMPSGAGFDDGTQLVLAKSSADKLVFVTSFHHMDEHGYYDGWTAHTVTVTPSFIGRMNIEVSGRDRNRIKDYIAEVFYDALVKEIT